MPFFRYTWSDGGITGNKSFVPDMSNYSARQAMRLQADIEAYVAQEWLPLKQGFDDDALVAQELAPRVRDYIHHTYVLNNAIDADGLEVQQVSAVVPAVGDLPEEAVHGVCVRFQPGKAHFTVSTTFWLFNEARDPQRKVIFAIPEITADLIGNDILCVLIDGLMYRLKIEDRTPLQERFNTMLNVFVEQNNLDSDPHAFATLPPEMGPTT